MTKEEFDKLKIGDTVRSKIKGRYGFLGVGNLWKVFDLCNEYIWIDHCNGNFVAYSYRSFDVYDCKLNCKD